MPEVYPFSLNHLRYFYEVARAGNMRRAATRISISQPALSKQVQALEEAMGLQLFYRSSKGLVPTPDGEVVYAHCERIFGHLRDLEEAADALRNGSAGRVTIAAIYSISTHLLPGYLRRFRETHANVRLRIVTVRSAQVLQALRDHTVHVGLVAGRPESDEFTAIPFKQNPLAVVTRPGHPFAVDTRDGTPLPVDRLHRAEMVCFDDEAPTCKRTQNYLEELGVEPRVMIQCPSIEVIKRLVHEGLGFAVLPVHCVSDEIESGKLVTVPVAGWQLQRDLYVVHLSTVALSPAVKQLVALFHAS